MKAIVLLSVGIWLGVWALSRLDATSREQNPQVGKFHVTQRDDVFYLAVGETYGVYFVGPFASENEAWRAAREKYK